MPRVWLGGMSTATIARAARRGDGLLLPQTLSPKQVARIAEDYRAWAEQPGPIGMIREVWVGDDRAAADRHRRRVGLHYTEEVGSWFPLGDAVGFAAGDRVAAQTERAVAQIAAGPADRVAGLLREVLDAGVDYLAVRPVFEFVDQAELHEQLRRIADEVAPLL
jgi:alkanesulfonate monooxygenase SsuD/methylene tetrahydromethanopterin reductase-like flavin-dependent oxidoreductase (luciferase family)